MEDAVRQTLANNPRLRALAFDIKAAERGLASARAFANPTITFTPGLTRIGSDEELLIAQPLEINGTRSARSGAARARLRAVEAEALVELRAVVFEVKSAYLLLARAQERRSLAEDLARHAEELARIAERQVELGNRPGVERTQTSIEAARARQQATLARAEEESARSELNTLIGRAPAEPLALVTLAFTGPVSANDATLVEQALRMRAEIALSQALQDSFQQEARLAKAEGFPDLTPHYRAESILRTPREGGFGIGISIPLLDYGSRRNRIKEAEASAKAEEQRRLAVEGRVRHEVVQALARLRAAEAVIQSFESGMIDEAKKLLEATRMGFQLGETTLASVLEAQRTFRSVQTEYLEALVSHAQAQAQLEQATGAVPADLLKSLRANEDKKS